MSEIIIKKVESKKDMKRFIEFNYELYKNHPYAVPDLYVCGFGKNLIRQECSNRVL